MKQYVPVTQVPPPSQPFCHNPRMELGLEVGLELGVAEQILLSKMLQTIANAVLLVTISSAEIVEEQSR